MFQIRSDYAIPMYLLIANKFDNLHINQRRTI
jgi:hypothetical protein